MNTEILRAAQAHSLERAAELLRAGQLVAFPTDTVYGVGALAFNAASVAAIYVAKQRPPEKAIPILVADEADLLRVTASVPDAAHRLIAHFWPGGLTLVLPKHLGVPEIVSAGMTLAVRIPNLNLARALMRLTGPLAATSANRSGQPSPITASDVMLQLGGRIAAVLDGGPCPGGTPSTVVDCVSSPARVVRQGAVSLADLRRVVPDIKSASER